MKRTALLILALLTGLLLVGFAAPALAENGRGAGGQRKDQGQDQDRARDAVAREGARPLAAILPAIEARFGARMVEVDVDVEAGRLVYEIELITPSGRLIEVAVDAATGDIVGDDTGGDTGAEPEG